MENSVLNHNIPKDTKSSNVREALAHKVLSKVGSPCRRVLFIHPPQIPEEDFLIERALNRRYWSYPPYGCGVLCAHLKNRGYVSDILDLNLEILLRAQDEKERFSYSSWKEMLFDKLEQFKPDLVAVSCMFTMTHKIMKDICDATKQYRSTMPVMAGGVHVTNARKLVLRDCLSIDFIGLYEADRSFVDMLDFVNGKLSLDVLKQIATLIDGEYIAIEERSIPTVKEIQVAPVYHRLPIGDCDRAGQVGTYGFMRRGRKAASSLSNKGCRAHCSFCSVATFNGQGVRDRSVINVVDEIERLTEQYDIRHITWLDDDLLFNAKRALELFNEMGRRKLGVTWDASNGLIAAAITPELMDAMVQSGCIGFNLGIESGNPEILRAVHKPGTVESFRKAKKIIDRYPQVFVKGFLMLGFPGETLKMILDTINLSLELALDWYSIQLLNPLPSTEIYGLMIEQGLIEDGLETSNVAYVFGPHGRQTLREQREKLSARDFFNLFNTCDLNSVPIKKDLGDYWFLMDYKLNYERIIGLSDRVKIEKIGRMLVDVCDRIAPDNPMAHLFQGIIDRKLERVQEFQKRARLTREITGSSDYWHKRFEALDLYNLLERLEVQE